MQYHKPDTIWESFGSKNYEEFLHNFLVKGNFHSKVPKDVVDAFITIEYLQAHAYYFWPMYDEALSKVLRTIEMSLKLRCVELGISLIKPNGSHKMLGDLIRDITTAESGKGLKTILSFLQFLRNNSMHPSSNSFAGGLVKNNLFHCVNTINTIFAEEKVIKNCQALINSFQKIVLPFKRQTLKYDTGNEFFLIHNLEIIDVFEINNNKTICLMVEPVNKLDPSNPKFIRPQFKELKNITRIDSGLEVIDKEGKKAHISLCNDAGFQKVATAYQAYLQQLDNGPLNSYQSFVQSEKGKMQMHFKYKYYNTL